MSEIKTSGVIEGSPVLSKGMNLLLEHSFKVKKEIAVSSIPASSKDLFLITKPLSAITTRSELLLGGDTKLLNMVSKYPSLISVAVTNPELLTILESKPSLITLAMRDPGILPHLAKRPDLLALVAENHELLEMLVLDPSLLILFKNRLGLLALAARNPALLRKLLVNKELLVKKSHVKQIKLQDLKSFTVKKLVRQLAVSQVNVLLASSRSKSLKLKVEKPLMIKFPQIKPFLIRFLGISYVRVFLKGGLRMFRQLFFGASPNTIMQAQTRAMNAAVMAQMGATSFTANRGRVIPNSGNLEDWDIEQETQTEKQLLAEQEVGPVREVEETSEVVLLKETIS